jgi:serine/threonine protein kinase
MGEVWRARHRLLARPAAIELIRRLATAPIVGSEAASRFEREAQAIASLRSPHTVDLFDFVIADDGTFYYVMELLEGLDAERIVNKFGPMPVGRVIHVICQLCHSLSEAESISLVHRDVKPANIILCHYGEDYDFVKVLDFGIVKAIEEPGTAGGSPRPAIDGLWVSFTPSIDRQSSFCMVLATDGEDISGMLVAFPRGRNQNYHQPRQVRVDDFAGSVSWRSRVIAWERFRETRVVCYRQGYAVLDQTSPTRRFGGAQLPAGTHR